jgi:hypothetical protein
MTESSCTEITRNVGCIPPNFISAVWGLSQDCKGGALSFSGAIGSQCQEPSQLRKTTRPDVRLRGEDTGAFMISNTTGFNDVHVFADPVTNNVCRLMFFPNAKTNPIQIGLPEDAKHHRRTQYTELPNVRRLFRMRATVLKCPDGSSYLRDLQCDYVDDEGNFSSSDDIGYTEEPLDNDSTPIPDEFTTKEKHDLAKDAAATDIAASLEKKELESEAYEDEMEIKEDMEQDAKDLAHAKAEIELASRKGKATTKTRNGDMGVSSGMDGGSTTGGGCCMRGVPKKKGTETKTSSKIASYMPNIRGFMDDSSSLEKILVFIAVVAVVGILLRGKYKHRKSSAS